MIVDNPKVPRGERFSAIVDLGLAAWARRWPLYLAIAILSIGTEFAAAVLTRYNDLTLLIVLPCIDAFAMAFVSLDVAARFSGEERSWRELAGAAGRRWPLVALLFLEISFIEGVASIGVFGTAEQTMYGLLILPALAVFGTLGITSVIASIDESMPQIALLFYAVYRSVTCAATWPNLGRVTFAGAMVAVPSMLQLLLLQWLTSRGFAAGPASFWANAPIDAVCVAPFQAFFTYLYLDFTVREQRR